MQTKTMSLIETITGTVVGYLLALSTQIILFSWLGIAIDLHQNMAIALIFTAVSIVRSYVLRRIFNHLAGRRQQWTTDIYASGAR